MYERIRKQLFPVPQSNRFLIFFPTDLIQESPIRIFLVKEKENHYTMVESAHQG